MLPDKQIERTVASALKRTEKEGREIRILRVRQAKPGKSLDMALSGELEKLVNECLAEPVVHQTFVHRDDGKRYTYDGISCMFRHSADSNESDSG